MIRFGLLLGVVLAIVMQLSCVQQLQPKLHSDAVVVDGQYPITQLDGQPLYATFRVEVKPGPHEMWVSYITVKHHYSCQFTWQAAEGAQYEIVAETASHPLTLYRWKRRNALWAVRLAPIAPDICVKA